MSGRKVIGCCVHVATVIYKIIELNKKIKSRKKNDNLNIDKEINTCLYYLI